MKMLPGWRVYGIGVMALGLSSLVFREFDPGQPVPEHIPYRTVLVRIVGIFIVVAGAAIEWRRTIAWGAAALALFYSLIVVVLLHGRLLFSHYAKFGFYEDTAMPLAIALGALILYTATARMDVALAARLQRLAQLAFGACTLVWGAAHFIYMNLTAPLVPQWLPPSQTFWARVTGYCFIAAGLAMLTGAKARLAAMLLTVMLACFGLLANDRILLTGLSSHWNWSESALNLTLIGAAWVVADSLRQVGQRNRLGR